MKTMGVLVSAAVWTLATVAQANPWDAAVMDVGSGKTYVRPATPAEKAATGGAFAPGATGSAPTTAVPGDVMDGLEKIFGSHPRTRVNNTTDYPFRTMGHVTFTEPDGQNYMCSGTLVGKHHVMTAGHCVWSGKAFNPNATVIGWATNVVFTPGANGDQAPYGSYPAKELYTTTGFTQGNDIAYDYAMIVLAQDVGTTVGWMGFGWSSQVPQMNLNVAGYPGDEPYATLWDAACPVIADQTTDTEIYHECDVYGGESGGPAYQYLNGDRVIYGITSGEQSNGPNFAKRINADAYNNLKNWVDTL